MCARDPRPAATLLLPYFEVNLADPQASSTVFTVRNSASDPALVQITLWTDWGLPTIYFPLFLTGFDQVDIDLAEVFAGNLPITADEASDPNDVISPHGYGPWDGSFPGCNSIFPWTNPVILGNNLERLVDGHTGQPVSSITDRCLGENHNDGIARGYITIDNVQSCSFLFPSDPGYFSTVASTDNQLWGDFTLISNSGAVRESSALVPIEASPTFDASSTPTGATFYGRYTQGAGGNDHREPLGAEGTFTFDDGANLPLSDLVAWRDTTAGQLPTNGYACNVGPPWRPLSPVKVVCFDQQEDAAEVCSALGDPPTPCFTLATQRLVAHGDLIIPLPVGFCLYDLGVPGSDSFPGDVDFPPGSGGSTAQSYVLTLERNSSAAALRRGVIVRQACEAPATATAAGGF